MNFLTKEWKSGNDIGLLIFRLIFAIILIYGHGFQKLSTVFGGNEIQFMDPVGLGSNLSFYLAAFAEGICSVFLIFGLFSRIASLILFFNFSVIFTFHAFIAKDGFPILELRFFYLFAFIALTITGPGKFSLDHLLFNRKG